MRQSMDEKLRLIIIEGLRERVCYCLERERKGEREMFFKWAIPGVVFVYYWPFSNKHYKFYKKNNVKNIHPCIQCWDSNPQPSEHASPSITTRPGRRVR